MKVKQKNKSKNTFIITPETEEDIYQLFLKIRIGDLVGSRTTRKITLQQNEGKSAKVTRELVFLVVRCERLEYKGLGDHIKVSGPIVESSDDKISLHSHHSISIAPLQDVELTREVWTDGDIDDLYTEKDTIGKSVFILVISESEAIFAKFGRIAIRILAQVTPSIPRKSSSSTQHQEALERYFDELEELGLRYLDEMEKLVLLGTGFTKNNFKDYLDSKPSKLVRLLEVKDTLSEGKNALTEYVRSITETDDPNFKNAVEQVNYTDKLLEELGRDSGKVAYGVDHIEKVIEMGAVDVLIILDELIYSEPLNREQMEKIIDKTKKYGGTVFIAKANLPNSEVIKGLGGLVGLLRFPVD